MIRNILIAALGALLVSTVHAQSSNVAIYGIVDVGGSWFSNIGSKSSLRMASGISAPSFLGFRGEEDLGGGAKTIFDLESQFAVSNGAAIGNVFGRNAWAGFETREFGSIKFGDQFDFMNDSLTMADLVPAKFAGGLPNYPTGPAQFARLNHPGYGPFAGYFDWDRTAQESVHSAIKYTTPQLGGFSSGIMYGFGEKGSNQGNTLSFGANYKSDPWCIGLAYTAVRAITGMDGTHAGFRTWGAGGNYRFGKLLAIADATTTRNIINHAAIWQASFGVFYPFDNAWSTGIAYTYMKGNRVLFNTHANQLGASVNYSFSKRTTAYFSMTYQMANNGANALINGIYSEGTLPTTAAASSSNQQTMLRIGLRHLF